MWIPFLPAGRASADRRLEFAVSVPDLAAGEGVLNATPPRSCVKTAVQRIALPTLSGSSVQYDAEERIFDLAAVGLDEPGLPGTVHEVRRSPGERRRNHESTKEHEVEFLFRVLVFSWSL